MAAAVMAQTGAGFRTRMRHDGLGFDVQQLPKHLIGGDYGGQIRLKAALGQQQLRQLLRQVYI